MVGKDNRAQKVTDQDVKEQLSHFQRRFNVEREKFEHEITGMLEDIVENTNPEETNKIETSGQTSII